MPAPLGKNTPSPYASGALEKGHIGNAMIALNPRQRAFVDYLLTNGCGERQWTDAARAVGYVDDPEFPDSIRSTVYRLRHNPKMQAAIIEEGKRRTANGLPAALKALSEVASDKTHKDFAKVALAIAAMNGISPIMVSKHEHVHRVEGDDLLSEVRADCAQLGIDFDDFIKFGRMKAIEHQPELPAIPDELADLF